MSTSEQPSTSAPPDTSTPKNYNSDPTLYLYTSLTAGSSHIITATSRMETILKANRIPFSGLDLATDEKARMLWGRRAGKDAQGRQRKLPALVQGGLVVGDLVEVEDWNEYGELKQHVKIVGTHNLVAPAKPYTKPGSSAPKPAGPPGTASGALLQQASAAAKASTPVPAPRGEMKNAPSPVDEATAGLTNAMRNMAVEASQKAKDIKKAATSAAISVQKDIADAVETATKQATDADLENAHKNVDEEKERIKSKGYKEEAPLVSYKVDTVLTGAGKGADDAKKEAEDVAKAADKENAHKNVEEEKAKRETYGYIQPSTTLTQEARELKEKAEDTLLGGGKAEEGAKNVALTQANDADNENAHKNITEEKAEIAKEGYKPEGSARSADTPASLDHTVSSPSPELKGKEINERSSRQSAASTAWRPTDVEPPVRKHRGSDVEPASLEEIRRIEAESRIEERDEDDEDEVVNAKTNRVIQTVLDEGENVKPKKMTEME